MPPRGIDVESKGRCTSVASLAFVPMMSGPPEILKYLSKVSALNIAKNERSVRRTSGW